MGFGGGGPDAELVRGDLHIAGEVARRHQGHRVATSISVSDEAAPPAVTLTPVIEPDIGIEQRAAIGEVAGGHGLELAHVAHVEDTGNRPPIDQVLGERRVREIETCRR